MTEKTKEKKPLDWRIVVGAIAGLTIIQVTALLKGVNGVLLSTVLALIAGFAGLSLPQIKFKKE